MKCERCGKRLTRKGARLVEGVIQCAPCMFGNAKVDGRPKGRDSLPGSGSADQRGDGEAGIRPSFRSRHLTQES